MPAIGCDMAMSRRAASANPMALATVRDGQCPGSGSGCGSRRKVRAFLGHVV